MGHSMLRAIYDEQCEICQAMVSWIRILDPSGVIDCVPLDPDELSKLHPELDLDECLRRLHVVDNDAIFVGWDAVAAIAAKLPRAKALTLIDSFGPTRWLADKAYEWLARNRYELSKCRGGACKIDQPKRTKRRASMQVFWTCYNLGFLFRFPLIVLQSAKHLISNATAHQSTFRRRVELLDGDLQLLFLGGFPTDVVPMVFGERFAAVVYRGVLIDPGSVKMRRSLRTHLNGEDIGPIAAVTATHYHEEHASNLDWASGIVGAPVVVAKRLLDKMSPPQQIPAVRRFFIGQPPPLSPKCSLLEDVIDTDGGTLEVIAAPGHCDDHVVFWDPETKVLLVGDSFMGAYFSSPNPEVDSQAWIETLNRLIDLKPEVMVEGHGHIHTLRPEVPDVPGVVYRNDPVAALEEKLDVLSWVRDQIKAGLDEGLQLRAVEATCFPWGMPWSWENVVADETARLMTGGEFSRSELVRSFHRGDPTMLPEVRSMTLVLEKA